MFGIKNLICPHQRNQVLAFTQVDDIVRVSGQHMNRLDVVTAYFKFDYLICSNFPLLNETVPRHNDKEFPLRIMPVLAFGNPRFGYIDRKLPMIDRFKNLSKAASVITVHFEIKRHLILGQIAQVHAVQFLLKTVWGNPRHDECLGLIMKSVKQLYNTPQRSLVGHWRITVTSILGIPRSQSIIGYAIEHLPGM